MFEVDHDESLSITIEGRENIAHFKSALTAGASHIQSWVKLHPTTLQTDAARLSWAEVLNDLNGRIPSSD